MFIWAIIDHGAGQSMPKSPQFWLFYVRLGTGPGYQVYPFGWHRHRTGENSMHGNYRLDALAQPQFNSNVDSQPVGAMGTNTNPMIDPTRFEIDWTGICRSLDEDGYAVTAPFLTRTQCEGLRGRYDDEATAFRSKIDMARYNFGQGEYKYFDYPLPDEIAGLRRYFYRQLAPVANRWAATLGNEPDWPAELWSLTQRCHDEGQARPTPLILKYGPGDFNCLHQDLYGPIHFPLQVVILLSAPREEFDGGELILVEQRPRMQSRPIVARLEQGAAAIIPVRERPRRGVRGYHRAPMRHGVGEVTAGERYTLGVIFHDAA
jgi:hypothetical protein